MSITRVATRYAKSLFGLAKEQGVLEEVNGDMKFFWETCEMNRELILMLKSPIIPGDKKSTILKNIFEEVVNPLTSAIFDIIIKKKREVILQEIANEFFNLYNEEKGIIKASVISAKKLSEQERGNILDAIIAATDSQVELIEEVEEDLLGGFVIKMGDKQYDSSIRNQLNKMKKEFTTA